MARLLEPAAFGLIAMAGVILRFGSYFAQMGVGSALIQKKEISDEDIRAAFTSAIFLGILFFVLVWFCAPLAIHIFDNEKVIPIVRVMALSFLITGLSTTALSLLRRNLEFRSLAITEIISYVLGYGVIGVPLAYNGFGVWSLVAAALCQSGLMAILSYTFSRHKLSFIYRWKYYRPLYSFGGRVSVISFFEFLGSNLDTLAIGHFIGAASLGIYNRAFMLVNLPAQYLTSSFSRVLFPSFSRVQKEIVRLKKAYLSTIMLFSAILLPTCLGIAASSREIVLLVLGEKWIAAVPVLQVLAIATPFNLLSHFGGIVCEATATLNIKLLMQIIYVTILGVLFYLMRGLGIHEFAMAIVFAGFIRFLTYLFIVKQICTITPMEYVHAYLPSIASALIIGVSIYFVATILREFNVPVVMLFAVELIMGVGLLIVIFFYGPQKTLREEIRDRFDKSGIKTRKDTVTDRLLCWFYKALSVN
ncbi:MAG: lipopolysaccharide biosynthesis protein [Deltaproteobacteria bacterium]|nr:lipopolysaccharide biosynthesis protein [Deltaproteobacteria bacterium]